MVHYLKKSLALISVLLLISSCDRGCVESYEFDTQVVSVDAKPVADGIDGNQYNNVTGGQSASWHETGLRTNGDPIVVSVSGGWTAWNTAWPASVNSMDGFKALRQCNMCFKKPGVNNCICAPGQNSVSEVVPGGGGVLNDCGVAINQDDPDKCTCTSQHGSINDDSVKAISIDYQKKDQTLLTPNDQNECKYNKGLGLYIGLFGTDGNTTPLRAYQLYSFTEICDVARNADGACLDSNGDDITRYLYTSPNNKIFVKDNHNTDDPSDDTYHGPREKIKVRISDQYYSDNYGNYNLIFLGGVIKDEDKGLLEYIVGTFEDALLGKVPDNCVKNCVRSGGAAEFLFNSIVKDSTFIFIVQLLLILYITLFGMFTLAGVVEINKKEVVKRTLKIALVIFFTSSTSWFFYNQFVVGFFKDAMDYIISMFMGFSDHAFFTSANGEAIQTNSIVSISQMERANDASSATRFSYIDLTIKMLFSDAVAKKIWSLFIGVWFGIFYIPAIYALIFFFTYTMLTAALVYIVAMIKLVFVIALGPLFIIASLFSQTEGMFKKWIAFMAARSMEIIILFIVLYTFLVMINNGFKDLFSYRACVEPYSLGLFSIDIVRVYTSRDLLGWLSILMKIGALIFLLRMVMEKIPGFSGTLVQISGTSGKADGIDKSAFGIAKDIGGKMFEIGKVGVERVAPFAAERIYTAAGFIADKSGVSEKWNNLKESIPIRNPMSMARDYAIDGAIKTARAEAKATGKTGAALDAEIRKRTFETLFKSTLKPDDPRVHTESDKAGMRIFGINAASIAQRLDEKLVKEPLKKMIKEEAKKLKDQDGRLIPIGNEMREQLKAKVLDRAKKEMSIDDKTIEGYLSNMKDLMKEQGQLTAGEAAKKFAGRPELQSKFLENLKEQQLQRKLDSDAAQRQGGLLGAVDSARLSIRKYLPTDHVERAEKSFIRKTEYAEKRTGSGLMDKVLNTDKGFGVINRINFLDKFADKLKTSARDRIDADPSKAGRFDKWLSKDVQDYREIGNNKSIMAYEDYVVHGGYQKDRTMITKEYNDEMDKFRNNTSAFSRAEIEKHRAEAEELARKKMEDYSAKLGLALKGEYEERPGDKDKVIRDDGAALPVLGPDAAAASRSEKADAVQEKLDEMASPSTPDPSKSKEQQNQDKDKEINDSIEELKKNLKEHYQEEQGALKDEINNLKAQLRDKRDRIAVLKHKKDKNESEKRELEQLEYEEQRDSAKVSIKEGQKQRIDGSLDKI